MRSKFGFVAGVLVGAASVASVADVSLARAGDRYADALSAVEQYEMLKAGAGDIEAKRRAAGAAVEKAARGAKGDAAERVLGLARRIVVQTLRLENTNAKKRPTLACNALGAPPQIACESEDFTTLVIQHDEHCVDAKAVARYASGLVPLLGLDRLGFENFACISYGDRAWVYSLATRKVIERDYRKYFAEPFRTVDEKGRPNRF